MKTVKVNGMSCGHCSARVEKAVTALGAQCKVDLTAGTAAVEGSVTEEAVKKAIEDAGYEVISIE